MGKGNGIRVFFWLKKWKRMVRKGEQRVKLKEKRKLKTKTNKENKPTDYTGIN